MVSICDDVRAELGIPLVVSSGTRCRKHNKAVGGAPASGHLTARDGKSHAVDIKCRNDILRAKLLMAFARRGIDRFEVSDLHIHADNAWWLPHPLLKSVLFLGGPAS